MRAQAPEPLEYNWTDPLKAHKIRALCQVTEILSEAYDKYEFSEDCLFLNIFVPGTI